MIVQLDEEDRVVTRGRGAVAAPRSDTIRLALVGATERVDLPVVVADLWRGGGLVQEVGVLVPRVQGQLLRSGHKKRLGVRRDTLREMLVRVRNGERESTDILLFASRVERLRTGEELGAVDVVVRRELGRRRLVRDRTQQGLERLLDKVLATVAVEHAAQPERGRSGARLADLNGEAKLGRRGGRDVSLERGERLCSSSGGFVEGAKIVDPVRGVCGFRVGLDREGEDGGEGRCRAFDSLRRVRCISRT